MKKLEFAKVQEGENKLAIEVQKESPVVAVTSQDGMLEYILIDNEYPEVVGDIIDLIESDLVWKLLHWMKISSVKISQLSLFNLTM